MVFYGLAFGAGNLSGSLLHNNAYNALVEIVAQTVTPFLVDRKVIGRRYGTIITMSIGFLACFGGKGYYVLSYECFFHKLLHVTYLRWKMQNES